MPPQELTYGDWNTDTATSTNIDIQGDTFTLATAIPDSAIAQYDASQLTGFSQGDTVATWSDETSTLGDLSATGAPIYQENELNGLPTVRFNDDYFDSPELPSTETQPNTIIVVARATTGGGGRDTFFDHQSSGQGRNLGVVRWDNNDNQLFAGASIVAGSAESAYVIYTYIINSTSSSIRKNGAQIGTGDAGTNGFDAVRVGASVTPDNYLDGDIAEFVVYNADLSAGNDLANEEQRLSDKWGIALA